MAAPRPAASWSTCRSFASSMSVSTSSAPSAQARMAVARPIPDAAPVIRTRFPSRLRNRRLTRVPSPTEPARRARDRPASSAAPLEPVAGRLRLPDRPRHVVGGDGADLLEVPAIAPQRDDLLLIHPTWQQQAPSLHERAQE